MSNSETLLKAFLNRLSARASEKMIEVAAEIAVLAKEAPDRIQKEWELIKEETYAEAERISTQTNSNNSSNQSPYESSNKIDLPKEKIQKIRTRLSDLSRKIDSNN